MKKQLLLILVILLPMIASMSAHALEQNASGVYQIGTANDLKAFAELVNSGEVNANAVLTADINKGTDGTMIGREGFEYQGFFDGAGHTITINTFSGDTDGTAIFRNVGANALIKDLKVQGTITSEKRYASGIAAWSSGTIQGCYIDVNVVSSMAGDATYGGVVAIANQGCMIENCLAKITINGAYTQNCGGIVGWCDGRTNVINCLVINDGSNLDLSNAGSGTIGRNDDNLRNVNLETYLQDIYNNRPGGASTNNYATNAWGNTRCVTIVPYDNLADGRICYQLNTDQRSIAWVQRIGTDPFPVPVAFGTGQVYASGNTSCNGKGAGVGLTYSNEGTVKATAHTFDKFGICTSCGCLKINALERDPADGYFILKTAAEIDLAEGLNRIQNGAQFSIKMANDITYIAAPGRYIFNTLNWFDGNFNGDGHTLTIQMTEMTGNNVALFPKFAGRRFENVIMHGTFETSGQYAGSIAGQTYRDRVNIINVFSDIDINTTHAGDNTTGGLIGIVESKTQVENTIYAGNINGNPETTESLAGFCGWSSAQTYYTNCAFIGVLNGAIGDSKTLSRNPSNITCTNVYFANSYGYEDEAKATLIENLGDIESGALAYALNGNEGGVERFYQKIGEDKEPMPIKKEGALVYASASSYRCDGLPLSDATYTNTPSYPVLPPHQFKDGICIVCGGLQENFLTPVDGWYEISNGAELVWWTNYAAKNLGVNARLTADIDMKGHCDHWANVGTEDAPFYGNFDGQFHTISNLVINKPQNNGVGLIAVMNSLPSANYGGLSAADARAAEGVYIKNVVLDETCSFLGRGYVGLVGMTAPWAGHVNIKGVMMCGNVTANGGPNASGLLGCVMSSACHITIDNCGMVGNVYGPKENASFSGWLGDWAEVTNCYAVGSVEGIQDDDHYFARYSSATITNCYAKYGTQVTLVTDEDIVSGKLAYLLNGDQTVIGWYQTIGEDKYPVPDNHHLRVWYDGSSYVNEEPIHNIIIFADANVKAICVANWDTNGDGELSEAEAAAVTSLGYVFKGNTSIKSFNELKYFTGLTSIDNSAFYGCNGLTSVTIPNSVTTIGEMAFYYCSSLTSISIPNNVTSIGSYAFHVCTSLTSFTIPNNVTYIGVGAFKVCGSLISVTIPNSVTTIDDAAFYGCSGLTSITIPNSITHINVEVFSGCLSLTSVSIPNSVTTVGERAFFGCTSLTSVTIPNSVTSIGDAAFYDCTSLTSITIPNGVTSIGSSAFSNCSGLTTFTIPGSVTSIGNFAFSGCWGLTSLKVDEENTAYDSRNNCNAIIETASNTLISGCKNTIIPENVTSIGDAAFYDCTSLTSITIPNSVTSIGRIAFAGCWSLTSVSIPNSVTTIGEMAFDDCRGQTSVNIGSGVTSIGGQAFYNCYQLKSVTIGSGVTNIGNYAFYGCGITFLRMESASPIEINANTFTNRSFTILFVPLGSKASYQAANYWKDFKNIVEMIEGDVNVDEAVNVLDVVDIARFVVGTPASTFVEILADINKDNMVNLGDAVVLVNEIAGDQNFAKAWRAPSRVTANDMLSLTEYNGSLSLNFENERYYTAFQFDLYVPEDVDVTQMMLNEERKQGHQLLYNKVENGHYRVAALSTSNRTFDGDNGELLNIALNEISGEGVSIRNIHFFDTMGNDYLFEDIESAITTSLTPTLSKGEGDIYDLQGRKREKIQRGVNIVNGRKIIKE